MTYQPLKWNMSVLLSLKNDKADLVRLFNETDLDNVERFTFERAFAIAKDMQRDKIYNPAVLDLGSSGGVFSLIIKMLLDAHVTSIDDDRYIDIQGENAESSIVKMHERLKMGNIHGVTPRNISIEEFLNNCPSCPLYDSVLLLNVLHHFYTGYGQCSEHGKMNLNEVTKLLKKIGDITTKSLYFEINSLVINDYETYLSDIMYAANFSRLEYISRSTATDGTIRALWCFKK